MSSTMPEPVAYHGGLVALEGAADIIATQLRLLPTSPQISILPPIQNYLDEAGTDELFDAEKFIKRIHHALIARNEAALSFLKDSTPSNKRLVFMNGGTPSAHALCIKAISEHETDGDVSQAQFLFNRLAKHGLSGLDDDFVHRRGRSSYQYLEISDLDPTLKAMRAADALDRRTANLQPSTDIDLTIATRSRSMSLPMCSYDDRFGDAAPFYVFGLKPDPDASDDQEAIGTPGVMAPRLAVESADQPSTEGADWPTSFLFSRYTGFPPGSPSCAGEAYDSFFSVPPSTPPANPLIDMLSPRSDFSVHSSDPLVLGRASVIHMRPVTRKPTLMRTKSLDRLYRDGIQSYDDVAHFQAEPAIAQREAYHHDGHPYSYLQEASRTLESTSLTPSCHARPRSLWAHSNCVPFTLSPVPPMKKKQKTAYVDRGTDADDLLQPEPPFQAVLPFTEDLVIHLKDAKLDHTLDSIIRAFKSGTYPLRPPETSDPASRYEDEDDLSGPDTPVSPMTGSVATANNGRVIEPQLTPLKAIETDEYDPFAYQSPPLQSAKLFHVAHLMRTPALPTPSQPLSSPASSPEQRGKFCDCDITICKTAVAIQNALRSILNLYFPPDDHGYHHFHFSLLPEMGGGLWKPVFRDADPGSPRTDHRRIDQVLAIGSQRGIKKSYLSGISNQLEKLGKKSGEVSRSGRLDFRYLVANAMQAFTAQPLAHQTHDNPFTNSYLLATLIIPHLETYFVTHSEVRFLLLEYPPDHLPTVLALQNLIGVDLMKVAQVVDSNADEPLPFTHIRGGSLGRVSNDSSRPGSAASHAQRSTPSPPPSAAPENVSISKANFLLTATATDTEITTFISTIRNLLIEVSRFYAPEDTSKSKVAKRTPAPLSPAFSPFPSLGLNSPPLSPPPVSPPPPVGRTTTLRPPSPALSYKAPSIAETVRTTRSGRSRQGRLYRLSNTPENRNSIDTLDLEDDSDCDMEERRLMPIYPGKPPVQKGNSRKALRFLGLA
ncbi:hypothetical protein SODALDRAFT_13209 [Sodiomyces alkalinus F11]|uniref:Gastric mucin-like protein n=1 Tax=Sodiomyces alkalinus (strain CBS 110278 / VKM F-3762 / F11) TaxID=1314773 RepID=A0A3N2Q6L2_SODAK|nr:hypothetical protein SODALDRAFT_13209 [Sodiomyces alkalinus F11]ROT42346.1 hypothetical protein SODALDRAFT_13209 [Sodiomyces alkalinus F11]